MPPGRRPEAIDSRLVFHVYACAAIPLGVLAFLWPLLSGTGGGPVGGGDYERILAASLVAAGICALTFAAIADPIGRQKSLMGFAHAHIMFGAVLLIRSDAVLPLFLPTFVSWAPLLTGFVLLYLAITGAGSDFLPRPSPLQVDGPRHGLFVRNRPAMTSLRSQYEQQIRQAARQEERARLARDLHDAVKQQLFVIQTAAATAQARFDTDTEGAKAAVDQVRSAGREAMAEMEAMLEQLQATPLANAGLVASLKKQCEALQFRTGAEVSFELGTLPDEGAVDVGARQAIFRVAQETLSNVARHARARHVTVKFGLESGRLALTVQDDGSGFGTQEHRRGMGMANIATRAAEVGANFEVQSAPGSGTTVRFSVPCEEPSAKPYLIRTVIWGVLLVVTILYLLQHGLFRPWVGTIGLIAAIAVFRYGTAAYRVGRARPTS
jgi:signal transduction histidine kinase